MSKLTLPYDLQRLSLSELWAIHAKVQSELIKSGKDTAERRNALASLENIERALSLR
jgi:hypothetical protein